MPSVVEKCRELSGNFTLSGEWSPCLHLTVVTGEGTASKVFVCGRLCFDCPRVTAAEMVISIKYYHDNFTIDMQWLWDHAVSSTDGSTLQ